MTLAPGPGLVENLLHLRSILSTPLPWWRRWQQEYGDVVRVSLGAHELVLLFHPRHVERVLQSHQRQYQRTGFGYDILRLVQGDGLLTSDGELWRRQRRLMQPLFHREMLESFLPTVVRLVRRTLDRWAPLAERGEPVDIYREMIALAVEVLGETMASLDMTGRLSALEPARDACNEEVTLRMTDPFQLPLWVPTARNRRFRESIATFDRLAREMIAERRAATEKPHDFLTLMLEARDEESGEPMSEDLMVDEIVTMAGAGNETSGLSLTWAFWEVARHPEVAERLSREVAEVLGTGEPGPEEVAALGYTRQVFREALRLYPPIYGIPRQATVDDEVDGYRVRAGSDVLLSQYVTQRHPEFWSDPDQFRPERFAEDDAREYGDAASRHRFAYFPFGGGAHRCIGQGMALMNSVLTLAMIHARYRLEPVDPTPLGIRSGITIRPDRKVWMRLHAVR